MQHCKQRSLAVTSIVAAYTALAQSSVLAVILVAFPLASWASLVTNGSFEASSSTTTTPTGWTQIGLTQGVFPYSLATGMPVYDGLNFYDLGGWANPQPNSGDGIQQTVPTTSGLLYTLSFGLSSEGGSDPPEILNVLINGSVLNSYTLVASGDPFTGPWVPEALNFTASSSSTVVAFTVTSSVAGSGNTWLGNNDPLLDGITLNAPSSGGAPEPATGGFVAAGIATMAVRKMRARRHSE